MTETEITCKAIYNRLVKEETPITGKVLLNDVSVTIISAYFPMNFGVQKGLWYLNKSQQKWLSGSVVS